LNEHFANLEGDLQIDFLVFLMRLKLRLRGFMTRWPVTERSSAWLEHLLWEQDVAGSNPVAPTIF
jgi:hypothetical protein